MPNAYQQWTRLSTDLFLVMGLVALKGTSAGCPPRPAFQAVDLMS
jgi:hypothetical protein